MRPRDDIKSSATYSLYGKYGAQQEPSAELVALLAVPCLARVPPDSRILSEANGDCAYGFTYCERNKPEIIVYTLSMEDYIQQHLRRLP